MHSCGWWIEVDRLIHELMHRSCAGGFGEQVFDYAEGNEPLRVKFGGSDETKFDVLIDLVRATAWRKTEKRDRADSC